MRFCSDCGAPNAQERPDGDTFDRHVCTSCSKIHYLNPKVIVGAVCEWRDKVLLCKRAIEPRAGYWTIPAGFMEMRESTRAGCDPGNHGGSQRPHRDHRPARHLQHHPSQSGADFLSRQDALTRFRGGRRDSRARPLRLGATFPGTTSLSRRCIGSWRRRSR